MYLIYFIFSIACIKFSGAVVDGGGNVKIGRAGAGYFFSGGYRTVGRIRRVGGLAEEKDLGRGPC